MLNKDNFCEKNKIIGGLISGDKSLLKGYLFVMESTNNCIDWTEYDNDDFTRELIDKFFADVTKFLSKAHPDFSYDMDKGYSGIKSQGALYKNTQNLDIKEIASLVREELKISFPDVKWSVRIERYSGGQSLNVTGKDLPFNPYSQEFIELYEKDVSVREINEALTDHRRSSDRTYTDQYKKLLKKVDQIAQQYNYNDSDSMTDYFDVRYYAHTSMVTSEWLEKINPNHHDVLRTKEFNRKWDETKKKIDQRAKDNKGQFPKWSVVRYKTKVRAKGGTIETKLVNAVVTKSINGRARLGFYSIAYATDLFDRRSRYTNEAISPSRLTGLDLEIYEYSFDEYSQVFKEAYFENPKTDSFDKYYKEALNKMHKKAVKDAILTGKDLSENVLKDYPELKKKYSGKKKLIPAKVPIKKPAIDKIHVNHNTEQDGIEITFPDKPSDDVRSELKKYKFRWSQKKGFWYAKMTASAKSFADGLINGKSNDVSTMLKDTSSSNQQENRQHNKSKNVARSRRPKVKNTIKRTIKSPSITVLNRFANLPAKPRSYHSIFTFSRMVEKGLTDGKYRSHNDLLEQISSKLKALLSNLGAEGKTIDIKLSDKDFMKKVTDTIASSSEIKAEFTFLSGVPSYIEFPDGYRFQRLSKKEAIDRFLNHGEEVYAINEFEYVESLIEAESDFDFFEDFSFGIEDPKKNALNGQATALGNSGHLAQPKIVLPVAPISHISNDLNKNTSTNPLLPGVLTGSDIMNMNFEVIPVTGEWAEFMQNPAKNIRLTIFGKPKNGKTGLSLQLADYLSKFGKFLYVFADQGITANTRDLIKQWNLDKNPNILFLSTRNIEEVGQHLETGAYDFVGFDMINNFDVSAREMDEFVKYRFPEIGFLLIMEATKDGNFRGEQTWTHITDAIVEVKDFVAYNSGRYGSGEFYTWPEKYPKPKFEKDDENTD